MRNYRQSRDVQVRQDSVNFSRTTTMRGYVTSPFIGKVVEVYSERMTCDIETPDGQVIPNVPVMTKAGVIDGEPYGEVCLPALNDYVIVINASFGIRHRVIIGTFIPYDSNEFTKTPVNGASKATLTKLLETGKPLEYRRVFKSGASVLIEEDGTITVETPDGSIVKIGTGASGITIDDTNGNNITMGASSVTINGNLEVLQ